MLVFMAWRMPLKRQNNIFYMLQKAIIYFLYFSLIQMGWTQKTWSLEDCVNYALEHNLDHKNLKYDTDISTENYKQAQRDLLPSLGGYTGYNIGFGRYVDPNTNDIITTESFSNSYGISAEISVFEGFRKWNMISHRNLILNAQKASLLNAKYQLAFDIMTAFYDVKFRKGLFAIQKQNLQVFELHEKTIAAKVNLGLKAKSELYDVASDKANKQLNLVKAANALKAAKLILMQHMNLKDSLLVLNEGLEISTNTRSIQSPELLFTKTMEFHPLLKQQQYSVMASQKALALRRSYLYPRINFRSGMNTGYYETNRDVDGKTIAFSEQFKNNTSKFLGFSLSLPIFSKWSFRSHIKTAKINIKKAETQLAITKQRLYKTIQLASQSFKALFEEQLFSERNIDAKTLAHDIAIKKFEKGLINFYDFKTSETQLTEAKIIQLSLTLQLQIQQIKLNFYNGDALFNIR